RRGVRLAERRTQRGDPRPRHQGRAFLQAQGRSHLPVIGRRVSLTNTGSRILILDCGSQFTQLIARRVREARVYSEIHPPTRDLAWIKAWNPTGIILSGGPSSVTDEGAPTFDPAILDV